MKRIDLFLGCNYNDYIGVMSTLKISSRFSIAIHILSLVSH
ncbi:transcriptional regulator, partial [Bacillus cereus]